MKNLILFTTSFILLMVGSVCAQNITYSNPWHSVNSPHGYILIGPANTSGAHIYTDRSRFFFNKPVWAITGEFSAYSTNNLKLQTRGTTRMTILESNGNAGIGTTTPAEKLHINGSVRGDQAGAVRISTGHGYVDVGPKNASAAHFITDRSIFYFNKGIRVNSGLIGSYDEDLSLRTQNVTRMTLLSSNGNVGIGTTNPTHKLSVNGNIRAKEVRVETGWSDYVFYDNYQLPTLEEEEQHIEEKGHLLGFESEADMEGEVSLGDVSRLQQAKIEEIMLHLIELNKEVKQLRHENEELRSASSQKK